MRWTEMLNCAYWIGLIVSGICGAMLCCVVLLPAKNPRSRCAAFQALIKRCESWKFIMYTGLAAAAVVFFFCLNALTFKL